MDALSRHALFNGHYVSHLTILESVRWGVNSQKIYNSPVLLLEPACLIAFTLTHFFWRSLKQVSLSVLSCFSFYPHRYTTHRLNFNAVATTKYYQPKQSHSGNLVATMCYQVIERYSVCKCLYYRHSVDPCPGYNQRGHGVQEKTVLVGYACSSHSRRRAEGQATSSRSGNQPDSGYASGGAAFQYSSSYRR